MKNILIIFDIDGTLTKTAEIHQAAFNRTLAVLGVKKHGFDLNSFIHHTDSFISKEIFERSTHRDYSNEMKQKFEKILFEDIQQQSIQEIKGASAFVNKLLNEGKVKFCFATGALRSTAIFKLNKIEIPFHEDLIVASDYHYSREGIIQEAILNANKHYEVEQFDRIISIGDGLWDLKTAQKLRLEFIGIGAKNKKAMLDHGMIHHINDFELADSLINQILMHM